MDEDLGTVSEDLDYFCEQQDGILHLNYRNLNEIPRLVLEDDRFRGVRRMYLKMNRLKTLPDDIGTLQNLVELYINSNRIERIPATVAALNNLQSLDLGNNYLSELTPAVGQLHSLEQLVLTNNKLTRLPKEVSQLQSLLVLDAMNNQLTHLPPELAHCRSLKRLLVDRNKLKWLPERLCHMASLEELSASGNKLLCLPLDLGYMKCLKSVYVDSNPYLHAVPVSMYSQELGFNGCGTSNYEHVGADSQYLSVNIDHDEQVKTIYLPREMHSMDAAVLPLVELALRAVYNVHHGAISLFDVPMHLYKKLCNPLARCQVCLKPVFSSAYPMIFEGQLRVYSLYRLCLCCSPSCVNLASIIVNLPLIFPNPTTLCKAVALVEA